MFGLNLYVISKGTIRACSIIVNHVYFLTYLTWIIILYPSKISGFTDAFYKIEGQMMFGLIKMIAIWNEWAGYEVLEAGEDITPCLNERTSVLVNHQSPSDVIMLFSAFIGWNQIMPNAMWIMDNFIKYSTVGVVSSIRKDFFIFQGKARRNESSEASADHISNFYLPSKRKWLILFPEGGFLSKRKKNSQKYGKLNNLPHLELVTIPRIGALKVIMNESKIEEAERPSTKINESIHKSKYISDVTIGYPNGKPLGFGSIIFGDAPPCRITVFYRLYPIDEISLDEEGLSDWSLSRWEEKEKLLEGFYSTGEFPSKENAKAPRPVKQNLFAYCALHVIFFLMTIIPYNMFILVHQCCFN